MVPSLREWLTRKQQETRQGRAELRLAERTAVWAARPERRRNLPSLDEWARIRLFTRSRSWTPTQRKMMRTADAHYAVRGAMLLACLLLAVWGIYQYTEWLHSRTLRERVLSADPAGVPAILPEIKARRGAVVPLLSEALDSESNPKKRLLLSMGLVGSDDPKQIPFLYDQLLQARPEDFAAIREILEPHKDQLMERLWPELAGGPSERRFRAACALVEYAQNDPRWKQCAAIVVDWLVGNPIYLSDWKPALEPIRDQLLPVLAESLEDTHWHDPERREVIRFYRSLASENPNAVGPLQERFAIVRPDPRVVIGPKAKAEAVAAAKQRAAVGATLAALGEGEKVWSLLSHSSELTLRNYLIERLSSSGIDPNVLMARFKATADDSEKFALILALGALPPAQLPDAGKFLVDLYETNPDPGLHAAARWTLGKWGRGAEIAWIDEKLATGRPENGRRWYLNRQYQTFSVLTGDADRLLPRPATGKFSYAMSSTEVTVSQFKAFRQLHEEDRRYARSGICPVNMVTWYDAAEYCNWLTRKEGLGDDQLCYVLTASGKWGFGKWEFVPEYWKRSGYRLPTGKEWEFASRAGGSSAYPGPYGEPDAELFGKYEWWAANADVEGAKALHPVGSLKPNDFGLFDVLGNVAELCQGTGDESQTILNAGVVKFGDLRGGTVLAKLADINVTRSTRHLRDRLQTTTVGFRICRTLPADSSPQPK
jgi:formylglycine-generating enzyme required for sulfatase activity